MSKGLDADTVLTDYAGCIVAAGFEFVGRYYKNLLPEEAQHLSQQGLYILSIYETNPTEYAYFSQAQGTHDAQRALQYAQGLNQPHGSSIAFTVDYDASPEEASGSITDYFRAIHSLVYPTYEVMAYANGTTLDALLNAGVIERTWLPGATGWSGSADFQNADIVQSNGHTVCGVGVDLDTSTGDSGGWKL